MQYAFQSRNELRFVGASKEEMRIGVFKAKAKVGVKVEAKAKAKKNQNQKDSECVATEEEEAKTKPVELSESEEKVVQNSPRTHHRKQQAQQTNL